MSDFTANDFADAFAFFGSQIRLIGLQVFLPAGAFLPPNLKLGCFFFGHRACDPGLSGFPEFPT